MDAYETCAVCHCHIKRQEPSCPFCGTTRTDNARKTPRSHRRLSRAQWLALGSTLAVAACKETVPRALPQDPIADATTAMADARGEETAEGEDEAATLATDAREDEAAVEGADALDAIDATDALDEGAPVESDAFLADRDAFVDSGGDEALGDAGDAPDVAPTCPGTAPPCATEDGGTVCCDDSANHACSYGGTNAPPPGCYSTFDFDAGNVDPTIACPHPSGSFLCDPAQAGSDSGVPCDRASQYCLLYPYGQGCISFTDEDASPDGRVPFPPQCAACPTCACVWGYRSWWGCTCVDLDDAGAIGISCGGCYGSPPARLERFMAAAARPNRKHVMFQKDVEARFSHARRARLACPGRAALAPSARDRPRRANRRRGGRVSGAS
jgi:hypothetical protein